MNKSSRTFNRHIAIKYDLCASSDYVVYIWISISDIKNSWCYRQCHTTFYILCSKLS